MSNSEKGFLNVMGLSYNHDLKNNRKGTQELVNLIETVHYPWKLMCRNKCNAYTLIGAIDIRRIKKKTFMTSKLILSCSLFCKQTGAVFYIYEPVRNYILQRMC